MIPPPTVETCLFCSAAVVCGWTNRWTFVNCFFALQAEAFPYRPPDFDAVAILTGGRGPIEVRMELVTPDLAWTVVESRHRGNLRDPLDKRIVTMRAASIELPSPGRYTLRIWSGDALISNTGLQVNKA